MTDCPTKCLALLGTARCCSCCIFDALCYKLMHYRTFGSRCWSTRSWCSDIYCCRLAYTCQPECGFPTCSEPASTSCFASLVHRDSRPAQLFCVDTAKIQSLHACINMENASCKHLSVALLRVHYWGPGLLQRCALNRRFLVSCCSQP